MQPTQAESTAGSHGTVIQKTSAYNYDAIYELTHAATNGNTATFDSGTGTTSYTWDFENRMTQVTLPGTGGAVRATG